MSATLAVVAAGHRHHSNELKAALKNAKRPRSSSISPASSVGTSASEVLSGLERLVDSEFDTTGPMTKLMSDLDACVDKAIDDHFKIGFKGVCEPLLDLGPYIQRLQVECPGVWASTGAALSARARRDAEVGEARQVDRFWNAVRMARQRNAHNLTSLGKIPAMAKLANGGGTDFMATAARESVKRETLMAWINANHDDFKEKQRAAVRGHPQIIAVFDNNQKNRKMKQQRRGSSSTSRNMTTQALLLPRALVLPVGTVQPGPAAEARSTLLYGDQLSISHVESMVKSIMDKMGDMKTAASAHAIIDAMKRVFRLPGDFHVSLHTLDTIFRFCYGGFLQACQAALGWTRLKKSPIDSYQLGQRLVSLILSELQRYELELWLEHVDSITLRSSDGGEPRQVSLSAAGAVEECDIPSFLDAVIDSRVAFRASLVASEDAVVQFTAQFMELAETHELYDKSVECKDSVACESLLSELMPFYAKAKKHKYVELAARSMEVIYDEMTADEREAARINRHVRYSKGKGAIAIDGFIEMVNDWDKEMGESGTDAGHLKKSLFLSLFRRADKTARLWHRADSGTPKSTTDASDLAERITIAALIRNAKCLEPKGRGSETLNEAWWAHVAEVKQNPKTNAFHTDEESSVSALFSYQPAACRAAELSGDAETGDSDSGTSEEEGDSEIDESALTPAQLQRLSNMSRYSVDERSYGDWKAQGRALLKQVHEKRNALKRKTKRQWLQLEEAIDHVEKSKRLRAARMHATPGGGSTLPSEGWRAMHATLIEDMGI